MGDEVIQNLTLLEIEKLLQSNRRSLEDFPGIPYPTGYMPAQLGNRYIYEERAYDKDELTDTFTKCFASLTGINNLFQLF